MLPLTTLGGKLVTVLPGASPKSPLMTNPGVAEPVIANEPRTANVLVLLRFGEQHTTPSHVAVLIKTPPLLTQVLLSVMLHPRAPRQHDPAQFVTLAQVVLSPAYVPS